MITINTNSVIGILNFKCFFIQSYPCEKETHNFVECALVVFVEPK